MPPLVAGVISGANIGSGGAGHSVGAMAATQVAAGVAYDVGEVGAKKGANALMDIMKAGVAAAAGGNNTLSGG